MLSRGGTKVAFTSETTLGEPMNWDKIKADWAEVSK